MIGLFIMDVTGSTSNSNSKDISRYLAKLEQRIKVWCEDLPVSYINYRMGDELFFVSSSPANTMVLSYYIKLCWPFKKQPIKFGISIGEAQLPTSNFEHWNDPLIKHARLALDEIKDQDLTDFNLVYDSDITPLCNTIFYYLTDILNEHTEVQRDVFLASLTHESQNELAVHLNKSVSTISAHLKKARSKQLHTIEQNLSTLFPNYDERMREKIKKSI